MHMVDGTDVAELVGHNWFFEITDPQELAYTYKIRPALDFGGIFVSRFSIIIRLHLRIFIPYFFLFVELHSL